MEKKALLAVFISLIIIIVYQKYFLTIPEEPPEKKQVITEKTDSEISGRVKKTPLPPLVTEKSAVEDREVVITSDLYTAVIADRGAKIKSWQLKNYFKELKKTGGNVDLITYSGTESFPIVGWVSSDSFNDSEFIYQINKGSVAGRGGAGEVVSFVFTTKTGISIEKRFSFRPEKYLVDLDVIITNSSSQLKEGKLTLTCINYHPEENVDKVGFTGPVVFADNGVNELSIKKLKEDKIFSDKFTWVGFENKYFLSAIIPKGEKEQLKVKYNDNTFLATISHPNVQIYPKNQFHGRYVIYLGPKEITVLRESEDHLESALNFGWFDVIAKPLLSSLNFVNTYTKNYGVAIIVLTVFIKILLFPLTHRGFKSMKDMQKIQPLVTKLREKFKDDREKLNKEIMELYRTNKVNPLGGCIPMVMQIPVFFAFYKVLYNSIEIRHSPFIWWIKDLSAPDAAFYIGGMPANVLPIFMGITMFIQQKMTPTTVIDPTQAKLMLFMPLIFLVILWNLPSGLVLYWTVTNILSIGQQFYINKYLK